MYLSFTKPYLPPSSSKLELHSTPENWRTSRRAIPANSNINDIPIAPSSDQFKSRSFQITQSRGSRPPLIKIEKFRNDLWSRFTANRNSKSARIDRREVLHCDQTRLENTHSHTSQNHRSIFPGSLKERQDRKFELCHHSPTILHKTRLRTPLYHSIFLQLSSFRSNTRYTALVSCPNTRGHWASNNFHPQIPSIQRTTYSPSHPLQPIMNPQVTTTVDEQNFRPLIVYVL
jgi:hypothetical protein